MADWAAWRCRITPPVIVEASSSDATIRCTPQYLRPSRNSVPRSVDIRAQHDQSQAAMFSQQDHRSSLEYPYEVLLSAQAHHPRSPITPAQLKAGGWPLFKSPRGDNGFDICIASPTALSIVVLVAYLPRNGAARKRHPVLFTRQTELAPGATTHVAFSNISQLCPHTGRLSVHLLGNDTRLVTPYVLNIDLVSGSSRIQWRKRVDAVNPPCDGITLGKLEIPSGEIMISWQDTTTQQHSTGWVEHYNSRVEFVSLNNRNKLRAIPTLTPPCEISVCAPVPLSDTDALVDESASDIAQESSFSCPPLPPPNTHRVRLCVWGSGRPDSASLVNSLHQMATGRTTANTPRGRGIAMSQIDISEHAHFSCWDMAGRPEVHVTHELFLTGEMGVCVLVCKLSDPRRVREQQLQHWLRFIKSCAMRFGQTPIVVLCGSHIDEIECEFDREDARQWCVERHAWARAVFSQHLCFPQRDGFCVLDRQTTSAGHCELWEQLQLCHPIAVAQSEPFPVRYLQSLADLRETCGWWVKSDIFQAYLERRCGPFRERSFESILRALHGCGEIVWFDTKPYLCDKVFLQPHWLCDLLNKLVSPESLLAQGLQRESMGPVIASLTHVPLDSHTFEQLLVGLDLAFWQQSRFVCVPALSRMDDARESGKLRAVALWQSMLEEFRGTGTQAAVLGRRVAVQNPHVDVFSKRLFPTLQVNCAREDVFGSRVEMWLDGVGGSYARSCTQCVIHMSPSGDAIDVWVAEKVQSGMKICDSLSQVLSLVVRIIETSCAGLETFKLALSVRELSSHKQDTVHGYPLDVLVQCDQEDVATPTHPAPSSLHEEQVGTLLGSRYGSHVLVAVGCSPTSASSSLALTEREVCEVLKSLDIEVHSLVNPTSDVMFATLRETQATMLHFAGHGDIEMTENVFSLGFISQHGGRGYYDLVENLVAASALGSLAKKPQRRGLGFVFLNACKTLALGEDLLSYGIPEVLCWASVVTDPLAHRFSELFYDHLADSWSFPLAFDATLKSIRDVRALAFLPDRDPPVMRHIAAHVFDTVFASPSRLYATLVVAELAKVSVPPLEVEAVCEELYSHLWGACAVDLLGRHSASSSLVFRRSDITRYANEIGAKCMGVQLHQDPATYHPLFAVVYSYCLMSSLLSSGSRQLSEALCAGAREWTVTLLGCDTPDPAPHHRAPQYCFHDPTDRTCDGQGRLLAGDASVNVIVRGDVGQVYEKWADYLYPLVRRVNHPFKVSGEVRHGMVCCVGESIVMAGQIAYGIPVLLNETRKRRRNSSPRRRKPPHLTSHSPPSLPGVVPVLEPILHPRLSPPSGDLFRVPLVSLSIPQVQALLVHLDLGTYRLPFEEGGVDGLVLWHSRTQLRELGIESPAHRLWLNTILADCHRDGVPTSLVQAIDCGNGDLVALR